MCPVERTAHEAEPPTLTLTALVMPDAPTGLEYDPELLPLPSIPPTSDPQHSTAPLFRLAQACAPSDPDPQRYRLK